MTAAVAAWAEKVGSSAKKENEFLKLASVPIASVGPVHLKGGFDKTWILAAAYPDGYGDLLAPLDEPRASQRKVMFRVPEYPTLAPELKPQGGARYSVEIPESDTEKYQLCFRVKTNITIPGIQQPQGGNAVFASVNGRSRYGSSNLNNGVRPVDQQAQQQIGANYVWIPAFYAADANNTQVPTAVNLKPLKGSKMLDLMILDTEPAIDLIALTANSATCSMGAAPNAGRVYGFQFDLSGLLGGTKATLTMQYQKSADGLAQVFSRPTIEIENPEVSVQVEGLYVVINDVFDRQLNTFASVSSEVKGGAQLSSADLIVPLGDAEDKIGVYIKTLRIVTP